MGIKWEDIHFGNALLTNSIFIGKSKVMKDRPELSVWTDRSKDISEECMYAVVCKLKQEQSERKDGKGYSGYKYADGSALLWVAPNYKIEVTKIEKDGDINVKDDVNKLLDEGVSVEEIAEQYSGELCITDLDMKNEFCHEDADCNDCWIECLNKELKRT